MQLAHAWVDATMQGSRSSRARTRRAKLAAPRPASVLLAAELVAVVPELQAAEELQAGELSLPEGLET